MQLGFDKDVLEITLSIGQRNNLRLRALYGQRVEKCFGSTVSSLMAKVEGVEFLFNGGRLVRHFLSSYRGKIGPRQHKGGAKTCLFFNKTSG